MAKHPHNTIQYSLARCSIGRVLVAETELGIRAVLLGSNERELKSELAQRFPNADLVSRKKPSKLQAQIIALIETPSRVNASTVALDTSGTEFQQRVWKALRAVPLGKTATYREIAKRLGKPKAYRAVAQACGRNPVAIVVPCHRIVGSDGSISGYRWGVNRKRKLLKREGVHLD